MPQPFHSGISWKPPVLTALVLVVLMIVMKGPDVNWDLKNYHFYTPSALLDGRYDDDIAAAQLQTWHNPALDFPFVWMVRSGLSWVSVSLWLAVPAFVALLLALRLLDMVWPDTHGSVRTWAAGMVVVSGAAMLPTIGTTFNDAFVAAGMLAALWWVLESNGRDNPYVTWLPVGLVAGMVTGLKLTGAMYCVALIAVAMIAGTWRTAAWRLFALALGGGVGVLITAGPWMFFLWQEHGNPLFPYFNQWFQSPDALAQSYSDVTFVPRGADAWLAPVHLLFKSRRFSEPNLADPRLLLGLIALLLAWFSTRRNGQSGATRILLVFVLVSYIVWVNLHGIYRYAIAVELVCSIAIVGISAQWLSHRKNLQAGSGKWLVALALVLAVVTIRPGWGRNGILRGLRFEPNAPLLDVRFPVLPANSLVLLATTEPLGYAVAHLPRSVPAISIHNNFMSPDICTRLQAQAEARVRTHAGAIFLLREVSERSTSAGGHHPWQHYGLIQRGTCQNVFTNLHKNGLELCPLLPDGSLSAPAKTLCARSQ